MTTVAHPGQASGPAAGAPCPSFSELTGAEVVAALQQAAREANRQAARVLRLTHEVARSVGAATTARSDETDDFGADEVRAALSLSHAGARKKVELAERLVERLPEVLAVLEAGLIDEPRARAFADSLADADEDLAHRVCARVLPEAPGLVLGALIARIEEVLIALDPGWAARREAAARLRRRVRGWRNPSGTGSFGGYDLPLDRVVRGVSRFEALAAAARRAGARAGIEALRADACMGLCDGTFSGLDDDEIVRALVEQHTDDADPGPAAESSDQEESTRTRDDGPAGEEAEPAGDEEPTGEDSKGEVEPADPPGRGNGRLRHGTVEVRGALTTLLGASACPGEIVGWGSVDPVLLRALVAARGRAEWRVVVVDEGGHLLFVDLTRRRPGHCADDGRGDIVELWVSESELVGLAELADELAPAWGRVCRDVVARFRAWEDAGRPVPTSDGDRRFPRAALARWVAVRDRSCVGPGCAGPAHAADLDHTHDHTRGGVTSEANLGPLCRHDHRLKHEGGWRLQQVAPGRFVWTSRCGQRVAEPARPVRRELPPPCPRPDGRPREAPCDLEVLADDEGDPTGETSSAWLRGSGPPWAATPDVTPDAVADPSAGSRSGPPPATLPAPVERPDEPPY